MKTPLEKNLSRRSVLASLALAGAGALAPSTAEAQQDPAKPQAACPQPHNLHGHSAQVMSPPATDDEKARLIAYFASVVPQLLCPAGGILKYPSISPSLPGKAYFAQVWDWDSYWTARGLLQFARMKGDAALKAQIVEHVRGTLLDFLDHQAPNGRLPTMMNPKDPDHFGSLDPTHNQAKPVMAQLALLIAEETGDVAWLAPVFDKLLAFHAAWLATNKSTTGLLVWSNGIGLGNDNDPTSSGRPPFSAANPLLNCMFHQDLRAVADLAGRLNKNADQKKLAAQADAFGVLLNNTLWDPRDRFYYTADVQVYDDRAKFIPNSPRGMDFSYKSIPIRIATFTGFLPLWCGLPTPEQAKLLLDKAWREDDRFNAHFGCRTLSAHETMYSLVYSGNPSNWLGPIWIIANYLVWRGLKNYGTKAEADDLANKTIRLLAADLAMHGTLNEYYHPDTGEALSHPGFLDWNMLVLEMIQDTGNA